jgi:hypothetical protein
MNAKTSDHNLAPLRWRFRVIQKLTWGEGLTVVEKCAENAHRTAAHQPRHVPRYRATFRKSPELPRLTGREDI